jgi:hypothetical protein
LNEHSVWKRPVPFSEPGASLFLTTDTHTHTHTTREHTHSVGRADDARRTRWDALVGARGGSAVGGRRAAGGACLAALDTHSARSARRSTWCRRRTAATRCR